MSRPASVERFLTDRMREARPPGAAWWIEGPRGVIDLGAVGCATLEPEREPLLESTPFDLASLTKPLCTALLLVLLEQERKLDLDAPAGEFIDGWRDGPYGGVSLVELAAHSAGLPAWRPLYLSARGLDGYLERIAAAPPAVPRGETLYSDLGYIALGAVLERVEDAGLQRIFAERIGKPLGLVRSGFATDGGFRDAAATERGNAFERELAGAEGEGFDWRKHLLRGEVHDGNAWGLGGAAGHAGLFGTLSDVATLTRELLRGERLGLGRRALDRLQKPQAGSAGRTVGMVTADHSAATRGILPGAAPGHTGFTGTSVWIDPSSGGLYVLLANRVHPRVDTRSFQPVRRAFHRLAREA